VVVDAPPVSTAIRSALEAGSSTCRAWPEQDEGPYHRADVPERRDVTEGAPGLPLELGVRLLDERGAPPTGASFEIWHCDALGRYSGFPPPGTDLEYVDDQTFLRGSQRVDAEGVVQFRTVYPGWYAGRTLHIHVRAEAGGRAFTSQLYFPEETNTEVLGRQPYAARPGRDTTNDADDLAATGGGPAVLDVQPDGTGYLATTCLVIPTVAA